jgi:hypothetical protein
MKEIPLTKGFVALVDDNYFEELSKYKWCANIKRAGLTYAVRRSVDRLGKISTVGMHRQIMDPPFGKQVDHINRNTLDNRRENLRLASQTENTWNMGKQKRNTTGFKGVWFDKALGKYRAGLSNGNKTIHIGCFESAFDAAKAYDKKALELRGDFACVNGV